MESQGLSEPDLETYLAFGYVLRVGTLSEVLNRERTLSLDMIRKLHKGLGIPADITTDYAKQIAHERPRRFCCRGWLAIEQV